MDDLGDISGMYLNQREKTQPQGEKSLPLEEKSHILGEKLQIRGGRHLMLEDGRRASHARRKSSVFQTSWDFSSGIEEG